MEVDPSPEEPGGAQSIGAAQPSQYAVEVLNHYPAMLERGEERILPDPAVSVDLAHAESEVRQSRCTLHNKIHSCRYNFCAISAVFSDNFSPPLLAIDICRFNELIEKVKLC